MRIRFIYLIIFLLPLAFPAAVLSQEITVKRSSVVESYKGKPYYIHFVTQGETLTAIAKAYNVSVEEITAENQTALDKGLKADIVLRIPQKPLQTPEKEVKPQEKNIDQPKIPEDPNFILYTVKKQETLYGISKQFNMTVEDLQNSNPGLEVLQEGMVIKIPKTKPAANTARTSEPGKTGQNPGEIVVRTGETLYSIAKANNTTVDSLIDLNPQIQASGGLKAGMVLKLHSPAGALKETKSTVKEEVAAIKPLPTGDCYNAGNIKSTYNVALLLPFLLEDTSVALDAPVESDPASIENFNYFQFYAGFMLAADTLEKYGLHTKINVLDAEKLDDTLTIRQTLRKPGLDKMDLFVGPVYASSFTIAARFAEKHGIGIVNPLSRRESIIEGNPFVVKAQVSNSGMAEKLHSFILKNYQGANIIAVQNDKKELKALTDDFSALVSDDIAAHTFTGTLQTAVFSTDLMAGIIKKLKPGAKNVVLMFSNNKTAVPNFVSLLNPSANTYDIILIGMDGWDELDLETEFLVNLNYHQVASSFVNYDSEAVKQFITRFRNKYGAVPLASKHAYLGYDIGMYFLTSLMWEGKNYLTCLPELKGTGLEYNFNFSALKPGSGLQNHDAVILKLQDYKMVKVE